MAGVSSALTGGREAASRHAWREAYELLSEARSHEPLAAEDLEALAASAWWIGRMRECIDARERAFAMHVEAGRPESAMRLASHLVDHHLDTSEIMIASAWLKRGLQLLPGYEDTAAAGYMRIAESVYGLRLMEFDDAIDAADKALELGTAHGDRDLMAYGLSCGGAIRVMSGQIEDGFARLDEATIAAVSGELGPLATGLVYCIMIHACSQVADYQRAGEYSEAARRWCERQSIAGFPGICRVHHAEVLKLRGSLADAEGLASSATDELRAFNVGYTAEAFHELGEIRLRTGELDGAAEAFAQAYEMGADPVPGLALLQVRRGYPADGFSTINRSVEMLMPGTPQRAKVLPAVVEIALAAGEVAAARTALDELVAWVKPASSPAMRASAEHASASVHLAEGDPESARREAMRAIPLWREVDMPYETARTRIILGEAHLALSNREAARMEWAAARTAFEKLGAMPDASDASRLLESLTDRARSRRDVKTFMFTDIVSSTNLLEAMGDAAWSSLIDWHDRTLRGCFTLHDGEEIKHTGDGFFVAFDSPVLAVQCAVHVQKTLDDHRRTHGFAPKVRIGIHATEASRTGDDYRGMGVHESARIAGLAGADEIIVSASTLDSCALPVAVSEPRDATLKGVAEPVKVVSVLWNA